MGYCTSWFSTGVWQGFPKNLDCWLASHDMGGNISKLMQRVVNYENRSSVELSREFCKAGGRASIISYVHRWFWLLCWYHNLKVSHQRKAFRAMQTREQAFQIVSSAESVFRIIHLNSWGLSQIIVVAPILAIPFKINSSHIRECRRLFWKNSLSLHRGLS